MTMGKNLKGEYTRNPDRDYKPFNESEFRSDRMSKSSRKVENELYNQLDDELHTLQKTPVDELRSTDNIAFQQEDTGISLLDAFDIGEENEETGLAA